MNHVVVILLLPVVFRASDVPFVDDSFEPGLFLLQTRAVAVQTETLPQSAANRRASEAGASLLASLDAATHADEVEKKVDPVTDLRPSQGGAADIVEFGVFVKGYGGIDLKTSTWDADLVVTARWTDARTASLVPPGSTSITLATTNAATQMWLPDLMISDRAKNGVEIISSAITVDSTGTVWKTERLLGSMRASLDLSAYPFDTQKVQVVVASSSLMFDELQLTPITNFDGINYTGVNEDIFSGKDYQFLSTNSSAYRETDGSLIKSRGLMELNLKRDSSAVFNSLMMPQLLLLLVSWSVFWFPLTPAYVMPRVATGALAFVALMAFSARVGASMPPDVGLTWLDVFVGTCQFLMIWAIVLNIFIDIVKEMHIPVGDNMNNELRFSFGFIALIAVGFLLCNIGSPSNDWLSIVSKVIIFGTMVPYMAYCMIKARAEASKVVGNTPRAG